MRRSHLAALRPRCPVCLSAGHVAELALERDDPTAERVDVAMLRCPSCTREFPVADGAPVLLAELRSFLQENVDAFTAREDLDPAIASLLGDALGPGTMYDARRSHLSSYGWGHWGDLDPDPPPALGDPAALLGALEAGLDGVDALGEGALLDLGCALGRSTWALAERFPGRAVLGVDASFAFARAAQRTLRTGRARYPVRRVGVVYEPRDFPVPTPASEAVDFWVADATALPFAPGVAALVTSLNLVDVVASPRAHLEAVRDALAPGGLAVIATPFDWSPSATPIDAWLGGHSQRGPLDGSAEQALDLLLGAGDGPWAIPGLRKRGPDRDVPWWVRLHDRSSAAYRVRVSTVERVE